MGGSHWIYLHLPPPGLRFLPYYFFPNFLSLTSCSVLPVTQVASLFPAYALPAGPELLQAIGPVDFCPLSFPGAAMSMTCPWGQPYRGPAGAGASGHTLVSRKKGQVDCRWFLNRKIGVFRLIARHCSWSGATMGLVKSASLLWQDDIPSLPEVAFSHARIFLNAVFFPFISQWCYHFLAVSGYRSIIRFDFVSGHICGSRQRAGKDNPLWFN